MPYCAEEWTPATAGLSEWGATESDVVAMKHQLFLFNQDKPSYARYSFLLCCDYYVFVLIAVVVLLASFEKF